MKTAQRSAAVLEVSAEVNCCEFSGVPADEGSSVFCRKIGKWSFEFKTRRNFVGFYGGRRRTWGRVENGHPSNVARLGMGEKSMRVVQIPTAETDSKMRVKPLRNDLRVDRG